MKTSTLSPKIRKDSVHFIVLSLAITFLLTQYRIDYINETLLWQPLAIGFFGLLAFYLHSLILLPILLKKAKVKRYLFYTIIAFIPFYFIESWLQASYLSEITFYVNGNKLKPFDNFVKFQKIDNIIGMLLFSFLGGVISFMYYILIIDKVARKELFLFKYLEFVVNIIIVGLLYTIAVDLDRGTSILLLTIVLIVFYINTFYITPIFVKKGKSKLFSLTLLAVSLFYFITMLSSFFYKISYSTLSLQSLLGIIFNLFGVLCLIYILSFVYGYFRLKIKAKEQILTLKLGAKESELNLLKSQVNPHFLFNTLNTLYGTALEENAPKTAESTAKLANLIRYMQEDINKDFIPLENEIKYLQDYITIQKLRCSVEPEIDTKFSHIENHQISPGLLIPFVENAFKYGIDPSKKSKLFVSVICDENTIHFECVNSYDESFKTYYKEQGFGIGIKNAQQRLELVYPKNHTFEVKKENNIFSVHISINIKA